MNPQCVSRNAPSDEHFIEHTRYGSRYSKDDLITTIVIYLVTGLLHHTLLHKLWMLSTFSVSDQSSARYSQPARYAIAPTKRHRAANPNQG